MNTIQKLQAENKALKAELAANINVDDANQIKACALRDIAQISHMATLTPISSNVAEILFKNIEALTKGMQDDQH